MYGSIPARRHRKKCSTLVRNKLRVTYHSRTFLTLSSQGRQLKNFQERANEKRSKISIIKPLPGEGWGTEERPKNSSTIKPLLLSVSCMKIQGGYRPPLSPVSDALVSSVQGSFHTALSTGKCPCA